MSERRERWREGSNEGTWRYLFELISHEVGGLAVCEVGG